MRESSVAQAFLQEGREEGREEGLEAGREQEARKIVQEVVQRRFGSFDPKLRHHVETTSDVAELEQLIYRAMEVATWDELLP
ncbi:MAG: hypothetical protein V4719_18055 [Planctomycetota bacterium]